MNESIILFILLYFYTLLYSILINIIIYIKFKNIYHFDIMFIKYLYFLHKTTYIFNLYVIIMCIVIILKKHKTKLNRFKLKFLIVNLLQNQ